MTTPKKTLLFLEDDPVLGEKAFLAGVAEEFASMLPVYDFMLWSPENNHVLGRR